MDKARRRTVTKSLVQEPTSTEFVKLHISEKQGILPEQQRLVFAVPSANLGAVVSQDLFSKDFFTSAQAFQVIVLQDQRSIGRLVHPVVEVQTVTDARALGPDLPELPLQGLKLVYDSWQPVSRLAGRSVSTDVRLAVNEAVDSSISFKVIGKYQGTSFVYPVTHSVSGRDLAAAVSLHLQQLDYIEQQRARHLAQRSDCSTASQPHIPRHHFTVQIGSEPQTCTLTINTAKEPHIQSITFNIGLLVVGSLNAAEVAAAKGDVCFQAAATGVTAISGGGSAGLPSVSMATAILPATDENNAQQLAGTTQHQSAPINHHTAYHSQQQLAGADALGRVADRAMPQGVAEKIDANGHWCAVDEPAAAPTVAPAAALAHQQSQQRREQQAERSWKHSHSTPTEASQQPYTNGMHHASHPQQHPQPSSKPHPSKPQDIHTASSGPWAGHPSLKAEKAALPSTPLTDDELSIRTATDTATGSSPSSSDDSADGVVMINDLAAAAAAAAAVVNSSSKGYPPPREVPLANGKLPSSFAAAAVQQNGRLKGGPVATFGPQELLAYQFAGQMPLAAGTDDIVRSTLAQHDLLREQPAVVAQQPAASLAVPAPSNGHPSSTEASSPPSEPQRHQHQQSSTDQGASYASRAAVGQQRSLPSYSNAASASSSGAGAGRGSTSNADYTSQRRGQSRYTSTSSTSSTSRPQQAPRQQASSSRSTRQDERSYSSRPAGSPSSTGSEPWSSSYQPGTPEAASSHVPSASTDLERLLQQVTPMLHLEGKAPGLEDLRLEDVWKFYQEPSLYGREVYTLGGTRGPSWSYFVPYLSAVQLFVPSSPKDPGTNRLYISDMEGWPKHMHLLFEYFERELPFNRMPLFDMIESLSSRQSSEGGAGALLMEQQVVQLHPASWFSVAWYPVYRIPDAPLTARFLTFHSFAQVVMNLRAQKEQQPARLIKLMPLQVIGLKWQNLQGERWLENLPESSSSRQQHTPGNGSSAEEGSGGGKARGRMQHSNSVMDMAWQAHLSELQATAERLSRGTALRILGQMGAEPADLRHPDFEFFHTRG